MSEASTPPGRNRTLFLILSALLVGNFLWRFFVTAHEYPSRTVQVLTMLFDGVMIIGLLGTRRQTMAAAEQDGSTGLVTAAFWLGLLAGLGLFAIRFTSTAAWYSGHRLYHID